MLSIENLIFQEQLAKKLTEICRILCNTSIIVKYRKLVKVREPKIVQNSEHSRVTKLM